MEENVYFCCFCLYSVFDKTDLIHLIVLNKKTIYFNRMRGSLEMPDPSIISMGCSINER